MWIKSNKPPKNNTIASILVEYELLSEKHDVQKFYCKYLRRKRCSF